VRIVYEYNNAAMICDREEQRNVSNQHSALTVQSLNGEYVRSVGIKIARIDLR
jgi:hypothetical protein